MLVQGTRRILGITLPPLKHLGPLLVVWGAAMVLLVFIRDLGSSLMFFGGFLALIYVATNRRLFAIIGLGLFAAGDVVLRADRRARAGPRRRLAAPVLPDQLYDAQGGSYQIAQSIFAQADGGLLGRGFGEAIIQLPGGGQLLPAAHTDLIYAVIVNELGLVGACGVLLVYLLIVERGFRIATLATRLVLQAAGDRPDRRVRAAGLRDRRRGHEAHPAHRRDAAVHLLRRVVDRRELHPARAAAARLRPRPARGQGAAVNAPIARLFVIVLVLFAALVAFTSRWSVFDAHGAARQPARTGARSSRSCASSAATIRAADGTLLARSSRGRGGTYSAPLPDAAALLAAGRRLLGHRPRPRGDRAVAQRRAQRQRAARWTTSSTSSRAASRRATTCA